MDAFLSPENKPLFVFLFFGAGFLVYVLPSIIALARRHPSAIAIILVDLVFGWTVLGWLLAFFWSLLSSPKTKK